MITAVVIRAIEIAPFSLQSDNTFSIVMLVINPCFLPLKASVYEIHKGKMAILTLLSITYFTITLPFCVAQMSSEEA